MSDLQEVTTAFKDPSTGGTFTGAVLIDMLPRYAVLAGGGVLNGFRQQFTVTAGAALQPDATPLELFIGEDANPPFFYYATLLDTQGRSTPLGAFQVTRPAGDAPYPAVLLEDLLTVNEE